MSKHILKPSSRSSPKTANRLTGQLNHTHYTHIPHSVQTHSHTHISLYTFVRIFHTNTHTPNAFSTIVWYAVDLGTDVWLPTSVASAQVSSPVSTVSPAVQKHGGLATQRRPADRRVKTHHL